MHAIGKPAVPVYGKVGGIKAKSIWPEGQMWELLGSRLLLRWSLPYFQTVHSLSILLIKSFSTSICLKSCSSSPCLTWQFFTLSFLELHLSCIVMLEMCCWSSYSIHSTIFLSCCNSNPWVRIKSKLVTPWFIYDGCNILKDTIVEGDILAYSISIQLPLKTWPFIFAFVCFEKESSNVLQSVLELIIFLPHSPQRWNYWVWRDTLTCPTQNSPFLPTSQSLTEITFLVTILSDSKWAYQQWWHICIFAHQNSTKGHSSYWSQRPIISAVA